jgi:signal transduction histidine kinase
LEDIIKYEFELKNKHNNLFAMLDNLHLPIFKLSYPTLIIKQINKKAVDEFKFFNLVSEYEGNFNDRKIEEVFPQIDFENCISLSELSNKKDTIKLNNYEINLGGKKRNFNVIMQPLLNTQDEIEDIIVVLYDISSEVAQQNKLMEILRFQEEFFSYISHEFKTPITVINASVQALQLMYKNEMTDKVSMYVNKIKKSSLQQLRLVNNLLDIIKADSGYLKLDTRYVDIVSLLKSITDSVSPIARQNGINLNFSASEKAKFIHVDDAKLEIILLNLLSNALKFTPSGKSIYVSLDIKATDYIIEVLDEGPGIPKDKQKFIFEKYGQLGDSLTRTSEGTGIGLCLVNRLVQALQGNLILFRIDSFKL